ncbi:platelet glycoprotein Ib alpha chain-like [Branchiostoma lanceolatum]|uniref:platelet glycoprotein Ib alpha chain-like n=1 Tax=Branchiostoma lanceolatum TaxID=7740 RepID=UPI0034520ECC
MASMARRCSLTVLLCLTHLHLVLPCPDVCTCTFGNTVVNCNDKSLQTVPQDIPTSVTSLMLRSNDISQLSNSSFAGLSLLYSLNLQSNKIRQIPKGVFASSIRYLYLKNNLISDITSGAFDDLSLLRELYLDNNAITNIQYGTFHGLVDLQTLSLISNAIDSVSNDSFSGLTKLRNLYLQDNAITTIPVGPFKRSPNIATLYIHNNPLRCDCVLYDLVQWFNTGGRYLGDPSALNCASSPFPDLVDGSLTNAASQLSICVSVVTDVISTSSNQTPTIPHLSSKIDTPTTKGSSTSPSRSTTTTNVVNTSSKRTVTKTMSASPPKTTPSSNASEAITTLRSTTLTTTHPSVRDTTVSSSIESKGNDTTPKATTSNTVHSVSVRSSITPKPSSTSGTKTKSHVDNRQTAPLNTTRATPSQSSATPQIFSSLQEKTATPRPYLTTKSKGNITAAGDIINKYTTGIGITSQNSTVLQILSTPFKTMTSTKSSLTTRSTMATTKRNTTTSKVTTTEQGSTTLNSTILQVTPTPQETSTKAHPDVTSSVGTLKQNTTTAEKTIQDTTGSSKALPPKRGTISVTEHLIGIEDVTVGETVTIRCDAASSSENITYKWSVDGKQEPDFIGPILRYIPQTNGSHRIQCTAHTEDGEGVSDIITLFVKPEAEIQPTISPNKTTTTTAATTTTVNETTTVRTYTSSISRRSTVHTTQKSTTNHTSPFQSTKASTSQAQSTSRQVSTAQTAVNTTAELQTTTEGVNVTIPKPNILIENAGEDSATPGNDSTHVIRVTENIIGIQDITVGETVTIRCDAEDLAAVCVMYKWRVDGEVLDGQNGQILRYTPETDGPHKVQCTAINNGMDGVSDVITVFALPKGKKLDVITRCDKDPHSGISWDNIVRDCDLHLHELAEIPVTSMNALDVAGKLKNITTSDNVTVDNVGDVRMIFENVVNASSQPEVKILQYFVVFNNR